MGIRYVNVNVNIYIAQFHANASQLRSMH